MVKSFNNDWLKPVEESKMVEFLTSYFGAEVYHIVKFYDEAYQGHLFQVYFQPGFKGLPLEERRSLRLGAFGLVTDNPYRIVPTPEDNFSLFNENPFFFEDYVKFVNDKNKGITHLGKTYSEVLNGKLGFYLNYENQLKLKEIKDNYIKSLSRKDEIIGKISNLDEEIEK